MDDDHSLPAFDPALALLRANGSQALVDELQGLLKRDLLLQRERLIKAAETGDKVSLHEIVHKIYGGSRYCGNPALEEATFTLEKALREEGSFQEAYAATVKAIDALLLVE